MKLSLLTSFAVLGTQQLCTAADVNLSLLTSKIELFHNTNVDEAAGEPQKHQEDSLAPTHTETWKVEGTTYFDANGALRRRAQRALLEETRVPVRKPKPASGSRQHGRRMQQQFRDFEDYVSSLGNTPVQDWTIGQWIVFLLILSLVGTIASCICGACCCAPRPYGYYGGYGYGGGGRCCGSGGCLEDICMCLCCYELCCRGGEDVKDCCSQYDAM